jgi:hypothetical protein
MSPSEMHQAIQECEKCHDVCLQAISHGLRKAGRYADPSHVTTLLDCVDMCATSANFMLRDSARHRRTCELCAEVCDACAKSCATFPDDEEMRRCEAECHRCAESCRRMASSPADA